MWESTYATQKICSIEWIFLWRSIALARRTSTEQIHRCNEHDRAVAKQSLQQQQQKRQPTTNKTASASSTRMSSDDKITIQLTVTAAQGSPRVPLEIERTITSTQLRAQAAAATRIPLAALKLIFRGRLLADNNSNTVIEEFKLEEGSVVHCMGKPAAEAAAASSEQHSNNTTATTTTTAPNLLPTVSVPPSTTATTTTTTATPAADPLTAALQTLRTSNAPNVYQTAIATLDKILSNIVQHPLEEKYRSLKVHNAAFQRRLGGVNGGDAAIKACGFVVETDGEGVEKYVMQASANAWPALQRAARTVQAAAALAQNAPPPAAAAAAAGLFGAAPPPGGGAAAAGGGGIMPGMMPNLIPPGMGGGAAAGLPPGMDSPEMQQMAAQMMSNPQALQAMFQVRIKYFFLIATVYCGCLMISIVLCGSQSKYCFTVTSEIRRTPWFKT